DGLSRSEVNLGLGLTADPGTDLDSGVTLTEAQEQHAANLFDTEVDDTLLTTALTPAELSNIELLMLLHGRGQWQDVALGTAKLWTGNVHGRLGDQDRILDFYAWLESNGLASAYFGATAGPPAPGTYPFSQVRLDDDADSNVASDDEVNAPPFRPLGGASYQDPDLGFTGGAPPHIAPYVPPFVHPLDYGGTGVNSLQTVGTSPNERIVRVFKAADGGLGLTNNPSAWLDYSLSPWQYQELPAGAIIGTDTLFGAAPYWSAVSGGLQANNPLHDFLIDEQNEVILDRRFARPEDDAVFSASEIEGLQLSSTDFDNLGASNRLRNLGIVNFDKTNTSMGREIRSRFTTESWDRLDFSIPPNADRSWEFTTWSGTNDFAATQLTFPPEFGSVAAGSTADPIRPELRLLLKTEFQYSDHLNPNNTSANRYPRHRLWINRLLSDDTHSTNVAHAAFDGDGNPQFRNLTPHPNLVALDAIDTGTDMSPITIPAMEHQNLSFGTAPALAPPFDNISIDPNGAGVTDVDRALLATAQEWWARYDRQRLARDIYVMLWLLGGGVDDTLSPYTQTAGLYSDSQIKEMAQFAVNVVDAMDRDSVITHFEYDKNLTDGWNISGGNSPLHADYATVDGVEAQQLTFSEALWIREPEITGAAMSSDNDHDATLYDDRTGDHHHLFIELRNGTPFPVRFNNDAWRIRVAGLPSSTILDNTITPQRGNALTAKFVGPGENFLIGTHDGESHVIGGVNDGQIRASTFRVDYDDDFTFETIVPYRDDPNAPSGSDLAEAREDYPDPLVDLDLCHSRDIMTESFAEHGNVPGYFIDAATFTDAEMVLVLERRRTLHGEGLINYTSDPWGGWIEVDRMTVDRRDFLLEYDDDPADIYDTTDGSGLLAALLSQERPEPLFADNAQFDTQNDAKGLRDYIGGNLLYRHTLGSPDVTYTNADPTMQPMANSNRDHQKNSQNLATGSSVFTLWQPHFDRDFSSVMELLSVPLLSPSELIYRDRQSMTIESGLSQPNSFVLSNSHTAGIRFQNPFLDLNFDGTRDEDLNGDSLFDEKDDNRWYRLLEFLTTEEGGEDTIREENNNIVRDPGRINLNTLRHESVLAAILDDPHIERFATIPFMTTDALDNARNWYNELQLARDGIDPISGLSLPGVPGMPFNAQGVSPQQVGAIPIRSASYVAPDLSDAVNSASWPNASNVNKAAHTILRRHVATTSPVTVPDKHQLGLFEARQTSDVNSDNVDYHTRNRLLAKLANQTTNRSNVFAVWMTVKYFEAHQPDATNQPNVVQIGAELADSPTLRRFYVVDRTLLEDAVQVDDNGTPGTPSDDIMTLNWRSFVVHQRTLPSN
ncbi:MAG: hypothetical protein KDA52_08265, partial [Planctomycetaceae bacterium]|nr:hypothetical protein [Planctomycetaceae bacterium]